MLLAFEFIVLLSIWDFLGAVHITSDIHLALQSHAVERQFSNWVFHVLIDERGRRLLETVDFFSAPAHVFLSGRLQGALDLLVLRCVNRDLRFKCLACLEARGVVLHEFVCASRPVQFPSNFFDDIRNTLCDVREVLLYNYIRNNYRGVANRRPEEQQVEGVLRMRGFENELERLISMNVAIALKIFYYVPTLSTLSNTIEYISGDDSVQSMFYS